jgi:[FeFe] hydrogenase H-cluster maturation GTPase HydF
MEKPPSASRLHIAGFGRRNAGKSSIVNAIVDQSVAIVSEVPGTTTDPVFKSVEIHGVGPCMVVDTAGLDDFGVIGDLRVARSRQILDRAHLALIVADAAEGFSALEEELLDLLDEREVPTLIVVNKIDLLPRFSSLLTKPLSGARFFGQLPHAQLSALADVSVPVLGVSALHKVNIDALKQAIAEFAPKGMEETTPFAGLISAGDMVVLVVPIDVEAPKGRLILPQVQALRDALDKDAFSVVVKADRLKDALASLKRPPVLVVTDSQAFAEVARDTPLEIPMTSFSVLYARLKGDFEAAVAGAKAIDTLREGDTIQIAEACTHHPIEDDIARVKIPALLKRKTGKNFNIKYTTGHDFRPRREMKNGSGHSQPAQDVKLIIHCGSCMLTRRETLSRYNVAAEKKIPITNYGIAIAYLLGILPRVLAPFRACGLLFGRVE